MNNNIINPANIIILAGLIILLRNNIIVQLLCNTVAFLHVEMPQSDHIVGLWVGPGYDVET